MRIETWGGAEGREARRSSRKRQEGDVTIPQLWSQSRDKLVYLTIVSLKYWA